MFLNLWIVHHPLSMTSITEIQALDRCLLTSRFKNLDSGFHRLFTKSFHTSTAFTGTACALLGAPVTAVVTAFLRSRPTVEAPRIVRISDAPPGCVRAASCPCASGGGCQTFVSEGFTQMGDEERV